MQKSGAREFQADRSPKAMKQGMDLCVQGRVGGVVGEKKAAVLGPQLGGVFHSTNMGSHQRVSSRGLT